MNHMSTAAEPSPLRFTKVTAGGSDYIVLFEPEGAINLTPDLVTLLSDQRYGVGGTGVIRLAPSESLDSAAETWFVDARNPDGTVADTRGDELLAAARFLSDRGIASGTESLMLATRNGDIELERADDRFTVELGGWSLRGGEPLVAASGLQVNRPGLGIMVQQSPHVVVALSSQAELAELDLRIEPVIDPAPLDDATTVFVVPGDPLIENSRGQLRMRTHDRMLGEVPASGTASMAAALAVRYWMGQNAPLSWTITNIGADLDVDIVQDPAGERLSITGDARTVFTGELTL